MPAAQALPSMRHSLPTTGGFRQANGGFTPANQPVTSRPQSPLVATPVASARNSPSAPERPSEPLVEINRENLVLRHDGTVYTWPECMVGVPRRKIHPGDPYWEPDWKDVRSEVVEAKERWHQKHQRAIELEAKKEKSGSSKYQIGRQVNRGTKILEFLDDEDQISPYQLLAKPFMHASKGGITSYDTLFRLCETLSELAKFNLDISPVDWMRHRLYEIMLESPDGSFNLPKIVHDFYHDPKLTDLRHKHGYKNIGRPSGQTRGGRQSTGPGPSETTPKQPRKRKSAASALGTPHDGSEPVPSNPMVIHDEGPFLQARSAIAKKPRTEDWERLEVSEPEAVHQIEVQPAAKSQTAVDTPKEEHAMNGSHEMSRDVALKV
ncbi:uncharacterized protein J7T54_004237 [Emericellopsis cladophorae]|uniref:Uncharacterized protein n=1 Tax=Emericellopsis cladophorae TaxID=2686198 RepID=A0A9P9XZ40_9HYPO|nr:uncharacterized protein J7T54_004237 [Emericellopsis cladophorae]KAI6780105.1 hypothetical protein J7T54_004237 [Emericellopsis cladophorae]